MSLRYNALHLHFVAARDAETRRTRQQQQGNAAATAAAALQARHEEISLLGVCTCSGILAAVCCLVTYHNVCVSALGINVRLCFGFTTPKAAAAEATKIAAKALRARQLYFVPSHELHKYTH